MRTTLLPITFHAGAGLLQATALAETRTLCAAPASQPGWLGPPRARLLVQAWAPEPMEANLEQSCRISSDCLGIPGSFSIQHTGTSALI